MFDGNLYSMITLVLAISGIVWGHALYLTGQFSKVKTLMFDKLETQTERILSKLNYHEEHDDKRFSDVNERFARVSDNLWNLRLEQASNRRNSKLIKTENHSNNSSDQN